MSIQIAYYRFVNLPMEVKKANGFRAKQRLDCVEYSNSFNHKGLEHLVNNKGMLFFYLTPARDFVSANSQRISEWSLTHGSLNLTSLYVEDLEYPEYAYGYPNRNQTLANGTENPFYPYRNDGYLIISNSDLSEIEILVIPNSRNLISSYYQLLIDGELNDDVMRLRKQAKPFYNYGYNKL